MRHIQGHALAEALLKRAILFAFVAMLALAPASASTSVPSWMKVDAAKKSVSMTILMAANGNNGTLNFNGYAHGQMTITVPNGWNVNMHVVNKGEGTLPHSLEILKVTANIPNQGIEPPAFSGAETVNLIQGMGVGQSDDVTFVADTPGKYWIFCGVPNHGIGGMWDYFVVSSSAKTPSVTISKSGS
ncbi:MAG: sulfocyanin-like copper-binding protein [Vulcanimicrobiaceae bacterium]